jgi:hypothetical protein
VLEHARDAETRGTPVFVEVFENSAHCAHIREQEDAERYWGAVQKAWDERVNGSSRVLAETGVGPGKKEGVDVKVEELGLQGSRPLKKRCTCSDCGR